MFYTWYDSPPSFDYTIYEKGWLNGGNQLFSDDYKSIHTEPYDLEMHITLGRNAQNIVFNKIIFRSNNNVIDLREKVEITALGNELTEEELYVFRNYGLIDAATLKERESGGHLWFILWYRDINVIYKKDRNFIIEYDITVEKEDNTKSNYSYIAEFNRKKLPTAYQYWDY